MANVPKFFVDADLCTECGDCIKAMPDVFRKLAGEQVAEVFNPLVDQTRLTTLQKTMTDCPGHAILWAS